MLNVMKWNYKRNGLKYSVDLEYAMFAEEVEEFKVALKQYLDIQGSLIETDPETLLALCVEMLDAWGDAQFVADGWLAKEFFSTGDLSEAPTSTNTTLNYMLKTINTILMSEYTYEYFDYEKVLTWIQEANDAKPLNKTSGKVEKGMNWVDPKEKIYDYLKSIILDKDTALPMFPQLKPKEA